MEKGTKIALVVAASGLAMNKYQASKVKGAWMKQMKNFIKQETNE
jgi:hypothetical protein